jgi:hypothetical protein
VNPSVSFREEVRQFGLAEWRKRFQSLGWTVVAEKPTGAFGSSRHMLRHVFPLACRRAAARVFGSHSYVFVLKPPPRQ